MKKLLVKIFVIVIMLGMTINITSCKAKTAQEDTDIVDNADVAKIEAEDDFGDTAVKDESAPTDESLQAALGESTTESSSAPELSIEPSTTDSAPAPEIAAAPSLDENTLSDSTAQPMELASTDPTTANLTTDPAMAEATGITETPIVETPVNTISESVETPILTPEPTAEVVAQSESAPAVMPKSTMKKLSEIVPYQEGDGWVNSAYIARPKESLKQISQKIYGSDRSKELKKINTSLKSRGPREGERVFYISPNRPMDSSKMMTFYEDTGMIPETYVAKKGDNIKKIGKNLLGYSNAWKELWVTNPLESQGKLAEGDIIRYWKSADSVPAVAMNTPTPNADTNANNNPINNSQPVQQAPPPMPEMPPPPDMNAAAPPPPTQPEMPPPPDMNTAAPTTVATPDIPPPPPPPETPPPTEVATAPQPTIDPPAEGETTGEGQGLIMGLDQTQLALAGVLILCVIAVFMIRVKKKKREAEMASMSETNVV